MEAAQNGSASFGPGFNNSFTALLELPPNQAADLLLHSPAPARFSGGESYSFLATSVPESSSYEEVVKEEQLDSDSSLTPFHANIAEGREKKVNFKKKRRKSRVGGDGDGDGGGEDVPYVHVRACRGKATSSHSLAERARREKINARMKMLQEMVPGCNKISGTASILDEIINHVQFLQRQVEFLSMKLAAADPRISFNLDNFISVEDGSPVGSKGPGRVLPSVCNEQIRPQYQHFWHLDGFQQPVLVKEDDNSNFIQIENTASSLPSHLKMEL